MKKQKKVDQMTEEEKNEIIEKKLEGLLEDKYPNCLLIFDCVPAFVEYLKMVKDKNYTVDRDTNYYKLMGFVLQELDLLYVSRTYLSDLDEITEKGLELLEINNWIDLIEHS